MKKLDEIKLLYKEHRRVAQDFDKFMKKKYGERNVIIALSDLLDEARIEYTKKHGKN